MRILDIASADQISIAVETMRRVVQRVESLRASVVGRSVSRRKRVLAGEPRAPGEGLEFIADNAVGHPGPDRLVRAVSALVNRFAGRVETIGELMAHPSADRGPVLSRAPARGRRPLPDKDIGFDV